MTSMAPHLSAMQKLSGGMERIAAAPTRNAVLCAASTVAHELADADGVCALPNEHSLNLFSIANDPEVRSLLNGSQLQTLVAEAREHILRPRPQMQLESPAGRHFSADVILIVPLGWGSTYIAIVFFWRPGTAPGAEQLALLPTLAWATSIALQTRQKEQELQHSREQHRLQTRELQHRVRNVLALVRSIIRRSSFAGTSAEDFSSHLEARVSALARTQGWLSIDTQAGSDLEDLVRAEFTANATRDTQFSIAGPPLRLSVRGTETIALTLHELTTNALKFGALAEAAGHIAIDWVIDSAVTPSWLHWRWCESGVAAPAPQRRGFGQELIERVLPYELGARTTLTFAPGGVRCEIDLPLNERTTSFGHADRNLNEDRPHEK